MNDVVLAELKTLRQDAGPQDFVFSNSRTGVNIDSIKTGWRNACEDAGLVNLRFHGTPRKAATGQWRSRMDIRDLLGHAAVRMRGVDTNLTPGNLCRGVSGL